jgi:hypothetical protein
MANPAPVIPGNAVLSNGDLAVLANNEKRNARRVAT